MTRTERLKRKIFEHGATALALARPNLPRGYVCPLCLGGFTDPALLTLEHVPPESIGGRPLVLTCKACNNDAGHEVDTHIHLGARLDEIAAGREALDARLSLEGDSVTVQVQLRDGMLDMTGQPKRSNPRSQERLLDALKKAAASENPELTFQLSYRIPHDTWLESVGWLKVGYLYCFAALGFNYILRPQLNALRDQIANPTPPKLPRLVRRLTEPASPEVIQFVFDPPQFRCIAVAVRDRIIILPDLENPSTLIERVQSFGDAWPMLLSGKALPLPMRAEHLLDFHPSAVRVISLDHASGPKP